MDNADQRSVRIFDSDSDCLRYHMRIRDIQQVDGEVS
jgi:hypothetical protein